MNEFLAIVIAYALGCVAVGYYLVRLKTGEDLRAVGSGATGGRNAGRALGKAGAIATGAGDVLKGVLAMLIAQRLTTQPWALACVMVAILLGHLYPIQLGFKGGKGLSAAFGGVLMYDWRVAVVTAVIALVLLAISRRRRTVLFLGGMASAPIVAYAFGHSAEIVIGIAVLIVLILYAHRDNLRESWNS